MILFFMVSSAQTDNNTFVKITDTVDLYLLIGQSNMAGRGIITPEFKLIGNDSVFMFNKDLQWVKAAHPLHFDKPSVAGVGPGLSFGIAIKNFYPTHKIGLIPSAVGGTSIESWVPGGFDKVTNTHPYDDAIKRLEAAKKYGTIKGVIWLQGESDSNPEKAKNYMAKLISLIGRIRTVAGNDSLPFIAGEIGQFKKQFYDFNKMLTCLRTECANTELVSSDGLTDKGDNTHFDAVSADEYGKRFAVKMKILLQHLKKETTVTKIKE